MLFRSGEKESDEAWEARRDEERTYQGRLEAIKLTGDPNVPRGEITFLAKDLSNIVDGPPADPRFQGSRAVHSQGHIADTGFISGEYERDYMKTTKLIISQTGLLKASLSSLVMIA